MKFHKFPSFKIINSKGSEIVGGKLVLPAIPCRFCFWPGTRERLSTPGIEWVTHTNIHRNENMYSYWNTHPFGFK